MIENTEINGFLIDSRCTRLINGFLGGYHYPQTAMSGNDPLKPVKNKYSHVQDALQYVTVKIFGGSVKAKNQGSMPPDVRRAINMQQPGFMAA